MEKNFLKRAYTIVELRTGFVGGSCALLGVMYGAMEIGKLNLLLLFLTVISAFMMNIVANIANEIRGFLKQEETIETLTGHTGSEGLIRKDASLKDAYIALIITSVLGISSGILIVLLTKNLYILLIGIIGFICAITYSLTPIAYAKFPIGEIVSGLNLGFLVFLVGVISQGKEVDINVFYLATISFFLVSFLMAANNTTDYKKDKKTRTTLAHLLGFRKSITIIIYELVVVFLLWFLISINLKNIFISLSGFIILIYAGLYKWYIPYFKVKEYNDDLSKEYGIKPLILILYFNFGMSLVFLINLLGR